MRTVIFFVAFSLYRLGSVFIFINDIVQTEGNFTPETWAIFFVIFALMDVVDFFRGK